MNTNKVSNPESAGLHLKSGNRLGKYRLKKCLGTGGHCEVWEARDRVEGIWVALKIPLADVIGRRDNEILLREVRAVSKLRHPNILSVKNADIINGHVILATELSTGTLEDHSKPMSFRRITSIIIQVLEGLAYAHNNHIVHCDVTPGNIFVFPDKRIALGDFGISLEFKKRMKTVDDFGTPGYVAPEQAYGRPTYRSDCFSVGLILYEYITGILPRWPFNWPFRGYERLRERTNSAFVSFIRKSLSIIPEQRFANAAKMLAAMIKALPKSHRKALKITEQKESDWHKVRREAFVKRYGRLFTAIFRCVNCDEPIAETMQLCPWCGSEKNRFDTRSQFSHICPRCHKGVLPEWRYCPWCYGPALKSPSSTRSAGVYYHALCKYCDGKLMRFMRYCPWCHRKVRQPWRIRLFPEICGRCRWSIDSDFWNYCPWCKQDLRP